MDDEQRKQVISHLNELRTMLRDRPGAEPQRDAPLVAQIDELSALLAQDRLDREGVSVPLRGLEQQLLGWEADHPRLVALAARVSRALEDAGL